MIRYNDMKTGILFGLLNILITLPALALSFLFLCLEFVGDNRLTSLSVSLSIGVDLAFLVTFVYFMLGVKTAAQKIKKSDIAHHTSIFIELSVIEHALIIGSWIAQYRGLPILAGLLVLMAVPVIGLVGLFMLQIGEQFLGMPGRLTSEGNRISLWYTIAGYLTTSVIFAPLGTIIFLVAKVYMLKLLRQEINVKIPDLPPPQD